MIEITKYFAHPNRDYAGNPLIEFMPHVSREKMMHTLASPVRCRPEERFHEPELRMQYVTRLKRYFVPLESQADLAFMAWNAVLHGYMARNPKGPSAAENFNTLCSFLSSDDVATLGPNEKLQTPSYILLMGTPGTGKSRTTEALFTRLPCEVMHHKALGIYQLVSVTVSAPGNGRDNKTLAWTVYDTLYKAAVKQGIRVPRLSPTAGIGVIRQGAYDLIQLLHLGILIVDEVQHAIKGSANLDSETMKFLTDLVNHLGIPIVLIGTWKLSLLMGMEFRLGRRVVSPESVRFRRMPNDEGFHMFLEGLFKAQYLPEVVAVNQGFIDVFYKHTLGVQDLAVKLMMMAQLHAIRQGIDALSPTLIDEVAKEHLDIVAPAVRMMRDGIKDDDPLLWDLEPVDFEAYFEALLANAALEVNGKKRVSFGATASVRRGIKKALVGAELASEKTAEVIAAAAVEEHPASSTAEHLVRLLKPATTKSPRVTKSTRFTADLDLKFEAFGDEDLRKIVYFAMRKTQDAGHALREARYFPALLDDIPL